VTDETDNDVRPASPAGPGEGADHASRIEWLHDHLRNRILTGELAAGTVMSQAALARDLGISRSPIREALRRLESEGLIEARHNQRVQIAELSIADMEEIYASRIVLEALALRVTIPELTPAQIGEMREALELMRGSARTTDHEVWSEQHSRFHLTALSGAGSRLWSQILLLDDHARRYRRLYVTQVPTAWQAVLDQDAALLDAIEDGDIDSVVNQWARHLASTALSTIAFVDPSYDARLVRAAIQSVHTRHGMGA
jgi:DNA-binding GntR family transcriptional regulator